jgi:nucleoside-diphosphate-sugar epimerase
LRIFVTQALANEPITVYEDGKQLRDFVNVEDVARANVLLFEDSRTDFEVFNAGGGRGYSVADFAHMVKEVTGSPSKIAINGEFRKTDTRNAVSDISKLRSLGWNPINGPEKSIRDYAKWIREEGIDVKGILKKSSQKLKELGVVEKS